MDDELIQLMARAAGLDLALQLFPDDVKAAALQVEKQRAALTDRPTEEPWPPMRVPD